ncbi:host-nuclease inhibitor Gam family protein [Methylobacterium iners]|uniref:Host-nuclease inhibitor protein Gam n=1 Tax=Methylobacterium iners TaxID=418707 RepID=A0ABQ4S3P2_9HYPH|nr:host-nuclease inhibitor Gam family protein [Methylobacterium iners]GJD97748.1 hypothetical protein OCOJLMKI_4981 [Methylobacterium iners]
MARAKTKAAGTNLPVPQNDGEAERLVARIGVIDRTLDAEQADHNAAVALLEEKFAQRKKELTAERGGLVEALNIWATAHRERLTNGGRTKTVQLVTGRIEWREGSPSVTLNGKRVSKTGKEVLPLIFARIAELQSVTTGGPLQERTRAKFEQQCLQAFLRVTTTLNKEAMHTDRKTAEMLSGVAVVGSGETFAVEPLASQIREVA